jgi:hypothetical protein
MGLVPTIRVCTILQLHSPSRPEAALLPRKDAVLNLTPKCVVTTVQGGDFRPLVYQQFAPASPPSKHVRFL